MNKPVAIKAEFVDYRPVKTRRVLQLVFEVPAEQQADVFEVLGYPIMGSSTWCGIARLVAGAGAPSVPEKAVEPAKVEKAAPKRSSLAAMLCKNSEGFQAWLVDTYWTGKEEIGDYDGLLKRALGITSKTEIDSNPDKGDAWERMLTTFKHRHTVRA